MDIGKRIKQRREELGLSQEDLARKVGYKSRSSVNKIETDGRGLPQSKIIAFAKALDTTPAYLMGWEDVAATNERLDLKNKIKAVQIPVVGDVAAGIPIDAIEEILDYEEISPDMACQGDFFGLHVKGDSMEPKFSPGDVVIVRQQSDVDSGDIAIVLINGNEATIKEVKKYEDKGIALVPSNPAYPALRYSNEDIETLPIVILGKVVELRAKF